MQLIVGLSTAMGLILLMLIQLIGFDFLVAYLDVLLIVLLSLTLFVILFFVFHERLWSRLMAIIEPKVEELSRVVSDELAKVCRALLKGDREELEIVSHHAATKFSHWYQKILFRRLILRTLVSLLVAAIGLTTLVLWRDQNEILKQQFNALSTQVSLQRQQWFLSQRTELMSILYDREACNEDVCPHLANLRTRVQAAITVVELGRAEIQSMEASGEIDNSRSIVQPETLTNLSYVDLSDADKRRQKIPGHGAYLANLNWEQVTLLSANLDHSSLAETNLNFAKLQSASLRHTNLNGVSFINLFGMGLNLSNSFGSDVDFTNADLKDVDFSGATITDSNFDGARLYDAVLTGTVLDRSDLSRVIGLTCGQLEQAGSLREVTIPESLNCPLVAF
jgi:uncharacterized protein YjbI with pentapeptide repeats